MNERIKELWVRSGYHADAYVMFTNMEKFAELIVRECCAQIENERPIFIPTEWDQGSSWGHKNSIDVIKQHFGVE